MTPATLIPLTRGLAQVDNSQWSDAVALTHLNLVKDDLWSAIATAYQEDYNWERWTSNSIALQSEYNIPEVAYNIAGAKILKTVSINYDGQTYDNTGVLKYKQARLVNSGNLPKDWDYYVEMQSDEDPIYYVADNSIFIAPAPKSGQEGVSRIKLTGIRKIPDYTIATTEAEMRLPVDQHQVLMIGCIPYALAYKGASTGEVQVASSEYERRKMQAVKNLSQRVEQSFSAEFTKNIRNNFTPQDYFNN